MKKYSESTLMRMTKRELIEQLRCAEHNQEAAEATLEQHIKNVKDWKPVIHGHWEIVDWIEYTGHDEFIHCKEEGLRCTNCAHVFKSELLWENNYCPNCGTKMDEVIR